MKKLFRGNSLEDCLESAFKELNIEKDKLKYRVVERKNYIIRKRVVIEVEVEDKDDVRETKTEEKNICEKNGTLKIIDGKIIVKDPEEGGNPATIVKPRDMTVVVDGNDVQNDVKVFKDSKIEVHLPENEARREFNIYMSDDRMEVYAGVVYIPKIIYELKDTEESNKVMLETCEKEKIDPPKYTESELKQELSKNKIVYGLIEENLEKVIEGHTDQKVLIAKGKNVIDGKDDVIEIKFKTSSNLKEDKVGNIDFKSIGFVNSVKKNDVLAVRHKGKDGENGCDVTGKVLNCKKGKEINMKSGTGCVLKDESIIALIAGKPSYKGNTFYVQQVHELNNDVDLSTGNVCFMGNVAIHGSVKENMKIECGNNLIVDKDVERSILIARGDILVKGSIVGSKICGGGEDVKKIKSLEHLEKFNENINNLMSAVNEIKTYNLLGQNKRDGEIIKVLLENKFKNIIKLCIDIISDLSVQYSDYKKQDTLVKLIRSKLMGMAPISIKDYSELGEIVKCADLKIGILKNALKLPVKVVISYCQDSTIESSGDVIVTSKGEYISNITANKSIQFIQDRSVARGGCLKALNEIKCKTVGSVAGVTTKLELAGSGDIWADIAYHNTIFKIGPKQIVLDLPCKNVHAYIKDGNIVVDKLML